MQPPSDRSTFGAVLASAGPQRVGDGGPVPPADSGVRYRLPRQLSRLIGREDELAQLTQLLPRTALLTLTGAAGVGKTRLAIESATLCADVFELGVTWIELGGLSEASLLV